MAADTISALAGLVTTFAGSASKFAAAGELGSTASDLIAQSEEEASNLISTAAAQSRALRQRANAALQDISTLNAVVNSNIRSLYRDEARTSGTIAASYAGSGVEQSGSPLLAQLAASTEVGRAIGAQRIRQHYGSQRLQFEIEQSLARAEDVRTDAEREAIATLRLRGIQADTLRRRQLRTILSGIEPLTSQSTIKNVSSLFNRPVALAEPGFD